MNQDLTTAEILIVDDEPANLKLLEKLLMTQGYKNLTLIQDPRQVMIQFQSKQPDLILLDINMPYLDGFEVMEQLQIKKEGITIPVIVLTAQDSRDFMLRALSLGARDFLTKPFDRTELFMRVENQLKVRQAHLLIQNQNAILETMVRERTEMLNNTRLQVVRRLGRAAEYRDNETGYHIMRMSQTSTLLARSMGWTEPQCELMLNASPMHDIGKIGIPDAILLKPGKLDPVEWKTMKTHAQVGADLLADGGSSLLDLAEQIALTHHEKWDGSGYPNGLKGEDIPLAGRIVAVADVFDALTSVRPYKKAWPISEATDYISQQAGIHFDPQVIEHFYACLDDILLINKRYTEPDIENT